MDLISRQAPLRRTFEVLAPQTCSRTTVMARTRQEAIHMGMYLLGAAEHELKVTLVGDW